MRPRTGNAAACPPLFSIATPSLNALAKLRRCVGSVRGQAGVAVEHLVNDAASTDGTAGWLGSQPDIAAVVEPDAGMYDGINRAWARSRGDILSWLNADEQYLPGALASVRRCFDARPEVDVLFGNYIVVDADGRPVALRREIPLRPLYVRNSFLNLQSCTLFFRRRLLDEGLLRFDSRFRYAADQDLILRLAASGAVFRHLPQYLSLFGIDGSNLSTHARAREESESIRLAHGGLGSRPLTEALLAARRIERLLRGAYRKKAIRYAFAVDETPRYEEHCAARVGGRYALDSAAVPEAARP